MKKLAFLAVAAVAFTGAAAGTALADHAATPIGYAHSGDGYIVVAEGDAGNPGPLAGYIGLGEDGQCHGAQSGDHTTAGADPVCGVPA